KDQFKPLQAGGAPPLVAVSDPALTRLFPSDLFLTAIYPQYPIARRTPAPLKAQNLFAVPKEGKVRHLTDAKGLEKYFRSALAPVKDDDTAKDATLAWLRLSQELKQDGFYKFSIPKESLATSTKDRRTEASGKAVVTGGGKGELTASLKFDDGGRLVHVAEANQIKAGIRPICQATKLLDADPVVRRMAEKDILVMGRAAKGYLNEQRAKASPELRLAIDRVWRRILDEGW
ncbi:MAG TPA: hypothetical protein VG013_36020, partial [Gemmataceae bacterium]|nr:hypothetical protein [Gemmataceae bacterium]